MLESINLEDVVTSQEYCSVVAIDIAGDNLRIIPTIRRRHDGAICETSFHLKRDQHVDDLLIDHTYDMHDAQRFQPLILC